jgi:hypothetical protein
MIDPDIPGINSKVEDVQLSLNQLEGDQLIRHIGKNYDSNDVKLNKKETIVEIEYLESSRRQLKRHSSSLERQSGSLDHSKSHDKNDVTISTDRNVENKVADGDNHHHHHGRQQKHINQVSPLSQYIIGDNNQSILHANIHWPIIRPNGYLPLPQNDKKYKLIVDVGVLYGSCLPCLLYQFENVAYLGLEAHPINFGVSYAKQVRFEGMHRFKYNDVVERLVIVPLAAGNETKMVEFNENYSGSCGSILKSHNKGWWCTHSVNSFGVPMVRLDFLLQFVPANIEFFYLKTDCEGADHLAIYGAGQYLKKFRVVTIECRPSGSKEIGDRDNVCDKNEMEALFRANGFPISICDASVTSHSLTHSPQLAYPLFLRLIYHAFLLLNCFIYRTVIM